MTTIVNNRWSIKQAGTYARWYVWQTVRDLNHKNTCRQRSINIVMEDPDRLLPAADMLDEHGFGGVATLLRLLEHPGSGYPKSGHCKTTNVIKKHGELQIKNTIIR
jgi:hypothetical protein